MTPAQLAMSTVTAALPSLISTVQSVLLLLSRTILATVYQLVHRQPIKLLPIELANFATQLVPPVQVD